MPGMQLTLWVLVLATCGELGEGQGGGQRDLAPRREEGSLCVGAGGRGGGGTQAGESGGEGRALTGRRPTPVR